MTSFVWGLVFAYLILTTSWMIVEIEAAFTMKNKPKLLFFASFLVFNALVLAYAINRAFFS